MAFLERISGGKANQDRTTGAVYAAGDPETLALVWERLRVCPVCGGDFRGHQYALLATTALASRKRRRIDRFLKAVERRDPADLASFHDWDERGENAEAYALRCPDGSVAIAVAHTAAEAPHFKNVIRCDSQGPERSRQVDGIVPGEKWAEI